MAFLNKLSTSLASRSIKYEIKELKNRIKELLKLACIWRYQLKAFSVSKFSHTKFYYFGLKSRQEEALQMLGLDSSYAALEAIKQRAFISEIPIPGSICIPQNLTSIIPLKNRSLDEVLMGFEKRKRRFINKAASGFVLNQITDIKDVARLNQEMLMPYASHRYGAHVNQYPFEFIAGMATKYGQLHLLLEGEKEVGCLIGYDYICKSERYWQSTRGGFPDFIFNDMHCYREKNVIITYLSLKSALSSGFDYYDLGDNSANTERGVVHFKRTFGAELSTKGNYNYFYFRLPKTMAAQFYWEKPLFAVEGKAVVLHLGLPDGVSVEGLAQRYKLLNYAGLSKVYLHCDSAPSSQYTEAVLSIYSNQKSPPVVKISSYLTACISLLISLKQAYLHSYLEQLAII